MVTAATAAERARPQPRRWRPGQVLVTASARKHDHGRRIAGRCRLLGIEVVELDGDRLTGLRGADERETYRRAKSTLAVVVSPPSQRRLQPIPPSADWRVDIARGCPAHCQYCYLAGSLQGPPVTRVYADLDEILSGLAEYEGRGTITSRQAGRAHEGTTFEASCYTDPLALEHLTGSLARTIEHFGTRPRAGLRFTTKYDDVDSLLGLEHAGRTRARFSVNSTAVERVEGGTARMAARLHALRRMALAGYPVGLTIAPLMPIGEWRGEYRNLIGMAARAVEEVEGLDLTVELITHRFTKSSKAVLSGWYPATTVEMDEEARTLKRTKFRGEKYVYPKPVMKELESFLRSEIEALLPAARVLYFT
jgi:spore photoproduct lyase